MDLPLSLGTWTVGGPEDTKMVTVVPFWTGVPAAGVVSSTNPVLVVAEGALDSVTWKPACWSWFWACCGVSPWTLGIGTGGGPSDSAISTVDPYGALLASSLLL